MSVKRSPEIAAATTCLLPQVLLLLNTAVFHIGMENVPLARKEKSLLPMLMVGLDACLADSAMKVPNLMKPDETSTVFTFLMWTTWSSWSILDLRVNCLYCLSIVFALANFFLIFRSDNPETL